MERVGRRERKIKTVLRLEQTEFGLSQLLVSTTMQLTSSTPALWSARDVEPESTTRSNSSNGTRDAQAIAIAGPLLYLCCATDDDVLCQVQLAPCSTIYRGGGALKALYIWRACGTQGITLQNNGELLLIISPRQMLIITLLTNYSLHFRI